LAVKEAKFELEGEVTEALRGRMFRIQLANGHETLGYLAGKMNAAARRNCDAQPTIEEAMVRHSERTLHRAWQLEVYEASGYPEHHPDYLNQRGLHDV
jgi:hypothetical protein